MPEASITSKGQVTIPAEIRRDLGLHPGDRVSFEKIGPREFRMRAKKKPLSSFLGILKRPGQEPVSVEEMEEAVLEVASERSQRLQDQD